MRFFAGIGLFFCLPGIIKNGATIVMTVWELFIAAVCLSMDAFAVSVCKGLSIGKTKARHCITAGLYFGIFQALMPLAGYLLASTVVARISDYSHYIAFVLLAVIGANMIREAIKGDEENQNAEMDFKTMFPLAIATSIDAFAVGVSYALVNVKIVPAVLFIGATTFVISAIGVSLGSLIGGKFRKTATIIGGSVLILLGVKILLEGIGIL